MSDAPPKKFTRRGGRRGMLGFYIGLGLVALLLVGGWLAWKPLRREYAIYRLTRMSRGDEESDVFQPWWIEECMKAACAGDRRAVELAVCRDPFWYPSAVWHPHVVLEAQPEFFIDVLDTRDDFTAQGVLSYMARNPIFYSGPPVGSVNIGEYDPTPLTTMVSALRRKPKPAYAMLADYAERRFAEELAAEKKKAADK